ncbi:MAG: GNAT family N-acetyltransferase [Candidatus Hydrogenedentes bacterium]|nr:GNAT family N-acetyltransferase [Candidatus Hydrogenedentota bacterium]
MELAIKEVESDEELRLACDLLCQERGSPNCETVALSRVEPWPLPSPPGEHIRIALRGGELAGALRINTETIRIGEARLKTACLGWVSTSPRYRGRGIAHRLIEDALHSLRQQRYHLAMTFGRTDLHRRFGFAVATADYGILVDTLEAATFESSLRLREAKPGDIPAIQRMHCANDTETACSIVRSCAHLTRHWQNCSGLQVLCDSQGQVLAYFLARNTGNHLTVSEVGVASSSVCTAVLGACGQTAAVESLPRLCFQVPPPHPFAHFLLPFHSIHEMRVNEKGGMLCLLDIGEALEHMLPEWENRLVSSALREQRTEITLIVDKRPFRIRTNRGALDAAGVTGKNKLSLRSTELAQLLSGYLYSDDALGGQRTLLSSDARTFLATIFPKRHPYVWAFDRV